MGTQLLDIQPRELKFILELKKQSSCSIQLLNKSQHHVAFKVKTTSPKKYCVRPNVGVVMPNSAFEFSVTMQAQRSFPPDMICKDKFLIQSTIVPAGTAEEDITTEVFSKVEGKFIEENKLRVALVSPPESPVLSPINGALKQGVVEAPTVKGYNRSSDVGFINPEAIPVANAVDPLKQFAKVVDPLKPVAKSVDPLKPVAKDVDPLKPVAKAVDPPLLVNDEESPLKDVTKINPAEEIFAVKIENDVKPYVKDVNLCTKEVVEGQNLVKDIAEMKTKLSELESKLSGAEAALSKLIEEKKTSSRERDTLREELAFLRSRKGTTTTVHDGFPLLFVIMVALISVTFGYISR